MHAILGDRQAALCRELTKRFEEVRTGPLSDLAQGIDADPPRGEVVIVVDRDRSETAQGDIDAALTAALETMSVKDAAAMVAEAMNVPRRAIYQRALDLGKRQ